LQCSSAGPEAGAPGPEHVAETDGVLYVAAPAVKHPGCRDVQPVSPVFVVGVVPFGVAIPESAEDCFGVLLHARHRMQAAAVAVAADKVLRRVIMMDFSLLHSGGPRVCVKAKRSPRGNANARFPAVSRGEAITDVDLQTKRRRGGGVAGSSRSREGASVAFRRPAIDGRSGGKKSAMVAGSVGGNPREPVITSLSPH
jgi:hypothetical protein